LLSSFSGWEVVAKQVCGLYGLFEGFS
jgi:hypothetical protein